MGTGESCQSCGAHLLDSQTYCTSCGAVVRARQQPEQLAPDSVPSSSKVKPAWPLLAAAGGVVAIALLGGGLLWASSGGSQDPEAVSAVVTPPSAPPTSAASPAPVVTVTATATTVVETPAPTETVYITPERSGQSSAPDYSSGTTFAGYWSGSIQGDYSNYRVVLDLDESISGWVSGTVTTTKLRDGSTGVWEISGTASGDRVVLTPDNWISRPNSTWERDTVTLVNSGGTLTASFVDPREPNKTWGSTVLS